MKKERVLLCLAIVLIALLSLWVSINTTKTAVAVAVNDQSWIDNFDSETLDSRWTWLSEDPTHWSLTANPGFLQIFTQSGGLFSGIYNNFLITDAPSGDYQITTRVIISPTETFHGAFIVVYGHDENYVRMGRRFGASGNEVNFRQNENGSLVVNNGVSETATSVYLRITKEGDLFTGYYSSDGNNYEYLGHTTATINNPKVGIISENGPSTTEIQTDYDFIELEHTIRMIYLPLIRSNLQ